MEYVLQDYYASLYKLVQKYEPPLTDHDSTSNKPCMFREYNKAARAELLRLQKDGITLSTDQLHDLMHGVFRKAQDVFKYGKNGDDRIDWSIIQKSLYGAMFNSVIEAYDELMFSLELIIPADDLTSKEIELITSGGLRHVATVSYLPDGTTAEYISLRCYSAAISKEPSELTTLKLSVALKKYAYNKLYKENYKKNAISLWERFLITIMFYRIN